MRSGVSKLVSTAVLAFIVAATVSQPAAADDQQECLKASKEAAAAAIAACTRAIKSGEYKDRDLSNLYHSRGYTWSWTSFADRIDRALQDYSEAIRIDPKAVSSLLNRSHIYNERNDYDRAIADANKAFEGGLSDYGKRSGYDERGDAYLGKHDYDGAIAEFDQEIRLQPNNAATFFKRGYAYQVKGDNDRAIADYGEVLRLNDNDTTAFYNRGNAYLAKGDLDRAIADYNLAIVLDPKHRYAYYGCAMAYQAKGDPDRAIADYSQAIALDPKYEDAYYGRAVAYLQKGDLYRATTDMRSGFWSVLRSWWPFFAMVTVGLLIRWFLKRPRGSRNNEFLSKHFRAAEPDDRTWEAAQLETHPNDDAASVEFRYAATDLIAAYQLHRTSTRRRLILSVLGCIVAAAVCVYLGEKRGATAYTIVVLILSAVVAALYGLAAVYVYLPWRARRNFANSPLSHLKLKLTLQSEGITLQSPLGVTTLPWKDFLRWRANGKTTLIYASPTLFFHFPARLAELGFPMERLKIELSRGLGPPLR